MAYRASVCSSTQRPTGVNLFPYVERNVPLREPVYLVSSHLQHEENPENMSDDIHEALIKQLAKFIASGRRKELIFQSLTLLSTW